MTNNLKIAVRIVGIAPLMVHKIPDSVLFPCVGGSGGKGGKPSRTFGGEELLPVDQARAALYIDNDGHPVLPIGSLYKAIQEAGRFHKVGKRQITTRDSSLMSAGLQIEEIVHRIMPGKWETDSRMVTNTVTKAKIPCHRPRFDEWYVDFTLLCDTEFLPKKTIRDLVDDGGTKIGVGVMRPACKGTFGRFRVDHWEEEEF